MEIDDLYPIEYCPTCKVDTIPLQPKGVCAFCDTQLTPMVFNCGHEMTEKNSYLCGRTSAGKMKVGCRICNQRRKRALISAVRPTQAAGFVA